MGMIRQQHIFDSWRAVREETAAAVEEFPAAEFEFRLTPELATFRQIARHTLDAGEGLAGGLLDGFTAFNTPELRGKIKEYFSQLPEDCPPADLAAALRESVERRIAQFAAKPEAFFAEMVTHMDGREMTRLEFLQWIKEHELTHRQQLFMYLRLKGLTPVTTRKRMARMAAKS